VGAEAPRREQRGDDHECPEESDARPDEGTGRRRTPGLCRPVDGGVAGDLADPARNEARLREWEERRRARAYSRGRRRGAQQTCEEDEDEEGDLADIVWDVRTDGKPGADDVSDRTIVVSAA